MDICVKDLKRDVLELLKRRGLRLESAQKSDIYHVLSEAVMIQIMDTWISYKEHLAEAKPKEAYYFSAEFLMGRALGNNLLNLTAYQEIDELVKELGVTLNDLEDEESDAGLGNGGLGRLAACFLDSLATKDLPGHGYGIRYRYGMFKQSFDDKGQQQEEPDDWLAYGDPWSVAYPRESLIVGFGGTVHVEKDEQGRVQFFYVPEELVRAIPYDTPVIGYATKTINTLRLWEAEAEKPFDLSLFNSMEHLRSVEAQNRAQDLSRVLYPNDNGASGKALRLKQQYFFVSASLQDLLRRHRARGLEMKKFSDYHVIQLNDTHPVLAVPELMRLFLDEERLSWEDAWEIVGKTFAYTNHTILAEALEKWPVSLFHHMLPRVFQIIEEINRRFLLSLQKMFPQDPNKIRTYSIISDDMVHMAWLAIHSCFSVNGVAAIHTHLLKHVELKPWYELYPQKFNNKTNGVTQRRWLLLSNPGLARLLNETIGTRWVKDFSHIADFKKYEKDQSVLQRLAEIKQNNKKNLAAYVQQHMGIVIDPSSIFDVQVKRLHEYKRQLLNILHIMYIYEKMLREPSWDFYPRTFIFGAKAASGYRRAKLIVQLINRVADRINHDVRVSSRLKVILIPNYCVSLAEKIIPAADVSEQISTAGKEASGTGNMKFMMNGALTLGTMDGANVEIAEAVGMDNVFIFGLSAEEVKSLYMTGDYHAYSMIEKDFELRHVVHHLIEADYYCPDNRYIFKNLYDSLLHGIEGSPPDPYFVLKDFSSYHQAHMRVDELYRDQNLWTKKALLNIASSATFSSDRTIQDYVNEIWHIKPIEYRK